MAAEKKNPRKAGAQQSQRIAISDTISIIPYHKLLVKLIDKKIGLDSVIHYALLSKIVGHNDADTYFEVLPDLYLPARIAEVDTNIDCDANIPKMARKAKHPARHGRAEPKSVRFKSAYENADAEVFPDEVLISSYKTQLATAPLLAVFQDVFNGMKFRAPVKGSPVYNKQKADKLKKIARKMAKKHPYVYFLTNTYAQNIHGLDRVFAWQYMREEMNRVQKALVRKYKISYITIFEATARQYPHTHTIIFSKYPLTGEAEPTLKVQKILYGRFFDKIKSLVSSPVFDLRRAVNKNLEGYVIKYVAKTFSKQEQPTLDDSTSLSNAERKALGSMIWPCIAGIRGISYSKGYGTDEEIIPETKVVQPRPNSVEDWVKQEEAKAPLAERLKFATRRVADLIAFRIKSNQLCKRRVLMLPAKHITPTQEAIVGHMRGSRYRTFGEKQVFARKMGCPGCLFEEAYEKYIKDPLDFFRHFPENPFVTRSEIPVDQVDSIHEDVANVQSDWRFIETPLKRRRISIGYTKKMQKEDRMEFADIIVNKRRQDYALAYGEIFFGSEVIKTLPSSLRLSAIAQ